MLHYCMIQNTSNSKNTPNVNIQKYDQQLAELREIINSFQKGNMPLSQAVEQYKQSELLLNTCKKTLEEFEQLFNIELNTTTDITNASFEDNMKRLDEIVHNLDSNTALTLQHLYQCMLEGKQLIQHCKIALDNVKHIIEFNVEK